MTTFEHALLGVNGVLATGLYRQYGWRIAVLGGASAMAPDWDGIPMLFDMARFEAGHRVWGHNLLACLFVGVAIGSVDYLTNLSGWLVDKFSALTPENSEPTIASVPETADRWRWIVWITVATLAALTQIPADAIVSGATGLTDWPLKPLWPFSNTEFVWPLVPWGNVGITVLFAVGMIALAKWPRRAQSIAIWTLLAVAGYALVWGYLIRDRSIELTG